MTPHPLGDDDNPYGTEGGVSDMRQRQAYPIKTEHVCVEALQTIWHMCNT